MNLPIFTWRKWVCGAALVLMGCFAACMAGCATTDQEESDLPWNTPQPWEGSPTIPGINDMN